MRVICAPDKFKGSLTAEEAARAMERGVRRAVGEGSVAVVERCPVADGGEGTVEALLSATGGRRQVSVVTGPRGEPVRATWGMWDDARRGRTAVVEMAAASGWSLLSPDDRDPTRTTTFGTGEMIRAALDAGAEHLVLGIGGSATCDGGCGAAQALGVRFWIDRGQGPQPLDRPVTGGMLGSIVRVDLSGRDRRIRPGWVRAACDVTNPLYGSNGAAYVYAPQKGATAAQVQALDDGLRRLARVVGDRWAERSAGVAVSPETPGSGAAGGLGYGLMTFLDARLERGVELVLDAIGFDQRLNGCDLCLTGEGRLDAQTASGKAVLGVARRSIRAGVPVIALAGQIEPGTSQTMRVQGVSRCVAIGEGLGVEESMRRAGELLERASADAVRGLLDREVG